jgi:S1-C subfamily serine protease
MTAYVEAAKWYHRAADQGSWGAQFNLGVDYDQGHGVSKNKVEAYKWYNIASANGEDNEHDHVGALCRNAMVKLKEITPEDVAEAQRLSAAFVSRKETPDSSSDNPISGESPKATGTGFFISENGFLITCAHVIEGASKVRLVTSAGTIDAKVVQVDAANDLALLKSDGIPRGGTPLPIAASRSAHLGGTVATIGFPDPSLQGFSPKVLAHGHHGGNRHWEVELRPGDDSRSPKM